MNHVVSAVNTATQLSEDEVDIETLLLKYPFFGELSLENCDLVDYDDMGEDVQITNFDSSTQHQDFAEV